MCAIISPLFTHGDWRICFKVVNWVVAHFTVCYYTDCLSYFFFISNEYLSIKQNQYYLALFDPYRTNEGVEKVRGCTKFYHLIFNERTRKRKVRFTAKGCSSKEGVMGNR